MRKNNLAVGHLKKGKFAKFIPYLMRNSFRLCDAIIKGKPGKEVEGECKHHEKY